jgi:hypothetical protein
MPYEAITVMLKVFQTRDLVQQRVTRKLLQQSDAP